MPSIADLPADLQQALMNANAELKKKALSVNVSGFLGPKLPVFLQLKSSGQLQKIGVIHIVHLKGDKWDTIEPEKIAKTVDEITQSILDRVALFLEAKKGAFYIDENGTIFDFRKVPLELHEGSTFSIHENLITWKGKPLKLTLFKSEGIIQFFELESGEIEIKDGIDQRKGKGFFINKEGELYRA